MTVFPLREVESFSKPGTADVTAGDRKKLSGLLKHYAGKAHPFSACKRDQIRHGLSEDHANRRCAVITDLHKGTTKWRGKAKEEAEEIVVEAAELLHVAIIEMGKPLVERLVAEEDTIFSEAAKLIEVASWMLPAAARRKDFKPLDPEKKKGAKDVDFEKKHPRGKGTEGGQFIRKGASNQAVSGAQRKLGMSPTGTYDQSTVARVKQYQRNHGLLVDGIIGAQTAASLLGRGKQKPGAMSTSTRRALKGLGASGNSSPRSSASASTAPKPIRSPSEDSLPKVRTDRLASRGWSYHDGKWWPPKRTREEQLEERTVHVETREDEPGVRRATIPKIRSALYDLSEPRNPTHTVKLPRGTAITVKPGVPTQTYSSFNRTFVITSADGETSKDVVGTDDAAEVAKEMDTTAGKKIEEAHLLEAAVRVSGYVTKKGRHVGAYSQIRKAIAKLSGGGAAHFPDGITVRQTSKGDYEVYGGGKGVGISTGLSSVDKAALDVSARSADSTHPKSIGGKTRYDLSVRTANVNNIPVDNPKLAQTQKRYSGKPVSGRADIPEGSGGTAASARPQRSSVRTPEGRGGRANSRLAKKTSARMPEGGGGKASGGRKEDKNGGDALDTFDTGMSKVPSTKRSREGSKRLTADNAAMAKREARERKEREDKKRKDAKRHSRGGNIREELAPAIFPLR